MDSRLRELVGDLVEPVEVVDVVVGVPIGGLARSPGGWAPSTPMPALRSFTAGLRRDLDAVVAGLTLQYNSGAVEGTVNRIKQLKSAMCVSREPRPPAQTDPPGLNRST